MYQLLALEQDQQITGSTSAYINLEATSYPTDMSRKLVLIELSAFSPNSYIQITNKKAAGILVMLNKSSYLVG